MVFQSLDWAVGGGSVPVPSGHSTPPAHPLDREAEAKSCIARHNGYEEHNGDDNQEAAPHLGGTDFQEQFDKTQL